MPDVTYSYTNRSPSMRINRDSFEWLQKQVLCQWHWKHYHDSTRRWYLLRLCVDLGSLSVTDEEIEFLRSQCPYFPESFLQYLEYFRLKPHEHVKLEYHPTHTCNGESTGVKPFSLLNMKDFLISCLGRWPHHHHIRNLVRDYSLRNPPAGARIRVLFSIHRYRLGLYQSRRECTW